MLESSLVVTQRGGNYFLKDTGQISTSLSKNGEVAYQGMKLKVNQ